MWQRLQVKTLGRLRGEFLEERRLLAGTPELLGDLGETVPIGPGFEFVEAGGKVFFTGSISTPGERELWKTDGTAAGTAPVIDLYTLGNAEVASLTELNGEIYFLAREPSGQNGLWKSDGTGSGTELVKSFRPAFTSHSGVRIMVNAGGTLYLLVYGAGQHELWKSDGTAAGTVFLNIVSGSVTITSDLIAVGNRVYFSVPGSSGTSVLWTSNGTQAGTVQVKSFNTSIGPLEAVGSTVFFAGRVTGSTTGHELWKSNGTSAGTVQVKDIWPGSQSSSPTALANHGGVLYFAANDGTNGPELWRSDGTEVGTVLVNDIKVGSEGSDPRPWFSAPDGRMYFSAQLDSQELWRTDGTGAGTEFVSDIQPQYLAELNGLLYFVDGSSRLRRFNPADLQVETIADGPFISLDASGGKLFLRTSASLVISDGTAAGTVAVPPPTLRASNSYASNFVEFNGATYFTAEDENGTALWRDDGPAGGVVRILGQNPDGSGLTPYSLRSFAGALYFRSTGGSGKGDWWRSDGTAAGTHMAIDMTDIGSEVNHIIVDDARMFFAMWNDGSQRLWRTDGTQAGTVMLAEYATELGYDGETLYFNGRGDEGDELWKTDGTVEGTVLVKDIVPGSASSAPWRMAAVGTQLYFVASNAQRNRELWTSDGTAEGTQRVEQIAGTSHFYSTLTPVGDTLFLHARINDLYGLWKVAGPGASLELVRTFSASVGNFAALDGKLYFLASNAAGTGLWRSDGTTAGTVLIQPLNPNIRQFVAAGSWLYFDANDGLNGAEVWRTDGTAAGTELVYDLAPGAMSSQPIKLAATSGGIYFVANDGITGFDPWVIRAPQVASRHLFYNRSVFDGDNPAANAADDGAIATDKVAYLPGSGPSTTDSVSSYSRGINGVMIDIVNPEDAVFTVEDFTFRVGTGSSPESWAPAPVPLEVVVRAGAGTGGSDRVTITWADDAIKNTWLQVIVRGNDAVGGFNTNTGLAASDVFYFGNRVGDTFVGAPALATVTGAYDEISARGNPGVGVAVTSLYDFNRDGVVGAADQLIARNNGGMLLMIDVEELAVDALAEGARPMGSEDETSRDVKAVDRAWWLAFALAAAEFNDELDSLVAF